MLHIRLFGKFEARLDSASLRVQEGSKAQELLVYLLLHRQRPHTREILACMLWEECSAKRSRAYLRKALWQIQTALGQGEGGGGALFRVDPVWIQVDPDVELWLDVATFEDAYESTRGVPGRALSAEAARRLADAVALYGDGLLLDCYEEWCLVERERLRHLELVLLDKLMEHAEAHGECDTAILYGLRILRRDPAREHTHRQIMRLHAQRGERSSALRQYRACEKVLEAELGVRPMPETIDLCRTILSGASPTSALPSPTTEAPTGPALYAILITPDALYPRPIEAHRPTEPMAAAAHRGAASSDPDAPAA